MGFRHYLQPLLMPQSVALVGATERAGTVGRIVFENLLAGGYKGELFAVNPRHRNVLGHRTFRSLATIGKRVDLAVIAAPSGRVAEVLAQGGAAGVRAAVVLTAPPVDATAARQWTAEIARAAAENGVRCVGPEAFGVVRTDLGLNATAGAVTALPGRLALIAQSGAVCSALIDFATPAGIGMSTVIAADDAVDVGFGELIDALVLDSGTDGILLYVETLRDARRFISALRAAAQTKPVMVLKAGRAAAMADPRAATASADVDAVFDAALKRAGTVRVRTYTQLFAAARIIAMGRALAGDRLAIVTNGRGPGLLAADSCADNHVRLAQFTSATGHALDAHLPAGGARGNPLELGAGATSEQIADAVRCLVADDNTDAVLVLHVPLGAAPPTESAHALASAARGAGKPVLAAWLGAIDKAQVRIELEKGGVADFFTPENAVEAFSFLAAYGRNRQWLLDVPPPQPDPEPIDLDAAERVRARVLAAGRANLNDAEVHALLTALGLPAPPTGVANTRAGAVAMARRIGFPVALKLQSAAVPHPHRIARSRLNLRNASMVMRAYGELIAEASERTGARWTHGVTVQKMVATPNAREVAIGVSTDRVFGPVIMFGNGGRHAPLGRERAVMLPPLNRRLALELIRGTRTAQYLDAFGDYAAADLEPLVRMLLQLSTLACALPWVREVELDPVEVTVNGARVIDARITVDAKRSAGGEGYRHMAIHPYPVELVVDATLADGTVLHVRPIRPEDAELERAFVGALSEESRYFRFFYRLTELTPAMLARFTQIDYDREMALVAVHDADGTPAFVGVARYTANPDRESVEFAVAVADAWHRRGVARMLMERLIACARRRGWKRMEGTVLRANTGMLKLVAALGFRTHDDADVAEQVVAVLEFEAAPERPQ